MSPTVALCATVVLVAGFVSPAAAQQAIPVRTLTNVVTTDSGTLRGVSGVRAQSDGHVIVMDGLRRRIVRLDSTLKHLSVLADTAAGAPTPYGQRFISLLPYLADSTLVVDFDAQAFIVVDPSGKFGRVMAPPKASDIVRMGQSGSAFDAKGRLVYRSNRPQPPPQRPAESGKAVLTVAPDSAPIMRADFDSRTVDTVAMMHVPVTKFVTVSPAPNQTIRTSAFNPLPQTDEWTLLPDGTIAIVRGQDYHIDWLGMDGKMTSSPKMPFDWKRVTSEEKTALLDSLKKADSTRRANAPPPSAVTFDGAGPPAVAAGRGGVGVAVERAVAAGGGTPGGPPPIDFSRIPFATVDASDLPDYYPPIRAGQVKSDPEGNVWILPSTSTLSQGNILAGASGASTALVYDVVNRRGTIVERVKLPAGRNLVGFGPGGVVFMSYAPAQGVIYLERGRIQR